MLQIIINFLKSQVSSHPSLIQQFPPPTSVHIFPSFSHLPTICTNTYFVFSFRLPSTGGGGVQKNLLVKGNFLSPPLAENLTTSALNARQEQNVTQWRRDQGRTSQLRTDASQTLCCKERSLSVVKGLQGWGEAMGTEGAA